MKRSASPLARGHLGVTLWCRNPRYRAKSAKMRSMRMGVHCQSVWCEGFQTSQRYGPTEGLQCLLWLMRVFRSRDIWYSHQSRPSGILCQWVQRSRFSRTPKGRLVVSASGLVAAVVDWLSPGRQYILRLSVQSSGPWPTLVLISDFIFTRPWWPSWANSIALLCRFCGITIRCPLSRTVRSVDSSARTLMKGASCGSHLGHLPVWIMLITLVIMGSFLDSFSSSCGDKASGVRLEMTKLIYASAWVLC